MSGGGSNSTTTVQKADPWQAAQPGLEMAMAEATNLFQNDSLAANPYTGVRVAGQGADTLMSQEMVRQVTGQPMLSEQASGAMAQMLDAGYQSEQLEAVKQNALDTAIPAATAQFVGSGMMNSTQAMDTVGRAAAQAVAPYEYDAFNNQQTNMLRAGAMAPQLDSAAFIPSQMMGQVGAQNDAYQQNLINADMAQYYETENFDASNLGQFANLMMGFGGQGGTSSSSVPGASTAQQIGGAALGGLGTYGALAAMPATAPIALPAGMAAGLLGLF